MFYVEDEPGVLREIPPSVWSETFAHADRTIASDVVVGFRVSTIWLGLDHEYGDGPPLIYETMVFAGEGYGDDRLQWRYTYRVDALRGHARAVAWAMAGAVGRPARGDA